MEPAGETKWLNVQGAAKYAGVSVDTIYLACARHELHHTRIGGRRVLRFTYAWLDKWMTAGNVPPRGDDGGGNAATT